MNNFTRGILVGIGFGLLFAPLKGEEMRRLLSQRLTDLYNSLPEDSRLNQYVHEVSDRVEQTRGNLRGYAQQAVSRVKDTSSTLGDMAHEIKRTGQDVAHKTKHAANYALSGGSQTRVMHDTDAVLPPE